MDDFFYASMKQCSRCKQPFPPTLKYFHADRTRPDGMRYECRKCFNAIQCSYREANKTRIVENHKLWREAHPDKIVEWGKQDREIYKERNTERHKQYYLTHKEENRVKAHNRRTRIYQSKGHHTVEDVQRQYQAQKGKCYYCAKKLGTNYHVDHVVPIARGGSNDPSNLVIACSYCNRSKGAKLPHEWPEGGRLL